MTEPTVGYLTKRFPRLSETFILDEILGLEAAGVPLRLFALAHPGESVVQPDSARVASPVTYLHQPNAGRRARLANARAVAGAHATVFARDPARYLRVVRYILVKRRHATTIRHFVEAGHLAVLLDRAGARHLHAAFAHGPASVAHFVHLLTGLPFSFAGHAKDVYSSAPDLLARKIAAARFVLACSESIAAELRTIAGEAYADRIRYAPHGVDTTRFAPTGGDHGRPAVLRLLVVGRLVPKKGHAVLLAALGRLAQRGIRPMVAFAGAGPERDRLQELGRQAGVAGQVRFLGARTHLEVAELYRQADAYVQPSVVLADGDRDGIPNALLEAMASGLPVIGSTVAGIPEVITDGVNGLLVPPGDDEALAAALAQLAGDPALCRRMGAAARATVVSTLDRTNCVQQAAALFAQPLEQPADAPTAPGQRTAGGAAAGQPTSHHAGRQHLMRRFVPYLRPVRGLLVAGFAASVAQGLFGVLAPWPLKLIFDSVLGQHPLPSLLGWLPPGPVARLNLLVAGMLLIAVALGVTTFLANLAVAQAGQRVVFDIRRRLFEHLQLQSLRFHQTRSTGDLQARLSGDASAIQNALVNAGPTLANNVVTLSAMLVIMTVIDWRFTVITLTLVPLLVWAVRHYLVRIKRAQRTSRRAEGRANAVAQEVLTSLPVVHAFGTEPVEAARYGEATGAALAASRDAVLLQSQLTPLVAMIMTAGTAMVVYAGTRAALTGRLTPGDLLVFMAYLRAMYTPARQLAKLGNVVGAAQAGAERIVEIFDAREEVPERPGARPPRRVLGELRFAGVSVRYPSGPLVLRDVDLTVAPGRRLALVGATGSGKSTLMRLVPRFLDPTAGAVLLDGTDLRDLTLDGLRRQIAFVPQEPYVFSGTVWENIAYGAQTRSREAAERAARDAGVYGMIAALPDGLDTVVAERGATLSGGQRQCLALARAMLRDAPLLLLDEPTTGLDAQSEELLLAALDRVAEGRTTLLISHQFGAVRSADAIAVLAGGRLVEVGTHAELTARRGPYWRLDRLQSAPAAGLAASS